MATRGPRPGRFVLNCEPSAGVDSDWTFEDAVAAGVVAADEARPAVDLRRPDWPVRDQGSTGACVGFATAAGVLHWHYWKAGLLAPGERPSPRFIWMANKETDRITSYPTTFIESAGTQTKRALRIARRYGCVLESTLPMSGRLSPLSTAAFYTRAAKYRIASYHNLRRNRAAWRRWLCHQGPILARVVVDRTWDRATRHPGRAGGVPAGHGARRSRGVPGGLHRGRLHRAQQLGHGLGRRRLRLRLRRLRRGRRHRGVRRGTVAVTMTRRP